MSKIHLVLTNPPEGMGAKQLFYNETHFINEWLKPHSEKLRNYKFEGKKLDGCKEACESLVFEGGSGELEIVSDDFTN